jgi:hypothetical protein
MNLDPRFLRFAAVCSLLSVLSTLLLIFLPELFAPSTDFTTRMARVYEGAYRLRAWVYLLHPFLVFTAALAMALVIWRRAPVLAMAGIAGFLLWAFNEAGQQTLTLFAFDRWRQAWDDADQTMRSAIRVNALMYDGIWDGMYALLLIGFAIGNASLGAALLHGTGLSRVVGAFMMMAFALTCVLFLGELGVRLLPEKVLHWAYPAIQPLGRALIGLWLWRAAAGGVAESRRIH